MVKKQLTERKKVERDMRELISLLDRMTDHDAARAELQRMAVSKGLFSTKELELRQRRYTELGSPPLNSPQWQAELQRLGKPRRSRLPPASSINTDPNDTSSLYWQVLMLAARKARGDAVEPIVLPSQSGGAWRGLDGKSPPQVLTAAEARRLYRWLWRIAPGLLNACGDELRGLIRDAGGIA